MSGCAEWVARGGAARVRPWPCAARLLRIVALAATAVHLAGCGEGSDTDAANASVTTPPPPPPYNTIPLDSVGRIEGTVGWSGTIPASTSLPLPDSLRRICGAGSLRITPVRVVRGGLTESVVWLADARRGKALPASRRFELATDRCRLLPQVQAAIAGGMLNVLSLDRLVHRLQFSRAGAGGTVEHVEQFDAGQVVPRESVLRLPGPVTVSSDVYPWLRAWIHVFDHPYATVTGSGGAFALDSIPPGEYTLAFWHPSTGQRDTTVTVTSGDTLQLRFELGTGAE